MSAFVSPRGLASPSRSARFNRAYKGKRHLLISPWTQHFNVQIKVDKGMNAQESLQKLHNSWLLIPRYSEIPTVFFGKTAVYIHVKHHLHISHQVGHSERGESALWGYPKALQHGWQDPQLDAATSSHPQKHLQTLSCRVRTSPETTALKDSLLTEHHATSNTNTQHTISAQPLLIF